MRTLCCSNNIVAEESAWCYDFHSTQAEATWSTSIQMLSSYVAACDAEGTGLDVAQCTECKCLTNGHAHCRFRKPQIVSAVRRLIVKALRPDTVRTSELQSMKQHLYGLSSQSISRQNPYCPSLHTFYVECTSYVPSGIIIPNTRHRHLT